MDAATQHEYRILVVDDDPLVRQSLARSLGRAFAVRAVGSVAKAIAAIHEGPAVDAIVCDLDMQPADGLELARALQADAPDLLRRLVFVSGCASGSPLHEGARATGRPILSKPVPTATLLQSVLGLCEA